MRVSYAFTVIVAAVNFAHDEQAAIAHGTRVFLAASDVTLPCATAVHGFCTETAGVAATA
jgi:hypothetical protein